MTVTRVYPPDWEDVSLRVRAWADWRCQHCGVRQGDARPGKKPAVLHAAHRDESAYGAEHAPGALLALCDACHNRHDARQRARTREANRRANGWRPWWETAPVRASFSSQAASVRWRKEQ